jgi:hypothetical protein
LTTVWLMANTLGEPELGGHFWVYLNWGLGLQAAGCRVVWLEQIPRKRSFEQIKFCAKVVRRRLHAFGLEEMVVCTSGGVALSDDFESATLLKGANKADLFLDMSYSSSDALVGMFPRSAMIDIDPGLTQLWLTQGLMRVAHHDHYFSIGETVGENRALFPHCGLKWKYTPPSVSLEHWPVCEAPAAAAYTTVTSWYDGGWVTHDGSSYDNSKRFGYLPYLDLPTRSPVPLELAISLGEDKPEKQRLEEKGWCVREASSVSSTPEEYRSYIQSSRGEFSCVKPSCVRLQGAWISDRTICYLATGRPAIVEHTGPSDILPDREGLFRFKSFDEAVEGLCEVNANYARHARAARLLAEDNFDAKKVATSLLSEALSSA